VGAIVCKLDYHKKIVKRGYIAMLAVDARFRKRRIGSTLVRKAIDAMIAEEADEVRAVLYTPIVFTSASCIPLHCVTYNCRSF
jgi:peptide alpha-N-acetyltransferase